MNNIIYVLTLRHLSENKKRTIVTILGISAATALITTILVGVLSFFNFFGELSISSSGYWHGTFEDLSADQINELSTDSRIKDVSIADTNTDICGTRAESDKAESLRVGNIVHLDENFIKNKVFDNYDGTLPAKENEVAVEEDYLTDNGIEPKIGNTITVELGARILESPDGEKEAIAGNYNSTETFESDSTVTYTITAILYDNEPTAGYDIVHYISDDVIPEDNIVSINLNKLNHNTYKELMEIAGDYGLSYEATNSELLISVFSFNKESRGVTSIIPLGFWCLIVIMATATVLIYNAFGMSLTERMRYLGMLASVGATKRQKRKSVFFEGFVLGVVGIPLGIVFGYIGAFFTLRVLGGQMIDADMFAGAKGNFDHISVSMPFVGYLFVIVISALTIFISALVPAIRASRVMPIDALRQANVIKRKGGYRTNPLIRLLFGYEGELAYKNIKRNGAKGTIITISIAISVVMFIVINHFCDNVTYLNNYDWNVPYQVYASCAYKDADRFQEALEAMKDVDNVTQSSFIEFNYKENPEKPEYIPPNDAILNTDFLEKKYKNIFDSKYIIACAIPDEDFKKLVSDNGLNEKEYFGNDLKGVIVNGFYRTGKKESVFNEGIIGQRLFYDEQGVNPPPIEIAGMVDYQKGNYIFDLIPKKNIVVYVPDSVYYSKSVEILGDDATVDFNIETKKAEKVHDEILDMFDREEYSHYYCSNVENSAAAVAATIVLLKTCMYGFTTLITLIALANMVNTIYTGVILRRKEFAMYRSVGMTEKGFKKMISLETILYGLRSLCVGIPIAILLSYAMTKKVNSDIPYNLNPVTYLIVIMVVFSVIGISMLLSINKIKNDEIIEVLKEDIC